VSRNFELLDQAGRLQEMLEPPAEHAAVRQNVPAEDTGSSTPTVEVAGKVGDEIAMLVHNLFLSRSGDGPRQVIFTGTESGSGCSWTCAHVAEVLASQVHASVCVVDCNLRSPSLHRQFVTKNHYGLSDSLLGFDPISQYASPLSRKNLWLLSCGSAAENPQVQLISERMRLRLSELRAQFDYVLIDVAPLNACKDGIVLGRSVDGVVLVLKANSSRREAARKAVQELQSARIEVLGVVLNQRNFPIPAWLYNKL